MSEIFIDLSWKLGGGEMTPGNCSNQHVIIFTPNIKIVGDSAPDWRGNELNSNPEQTLAASISSCHDLNNIINLLAQCNRSTQSI